MTTAVASDPAGRADRALAVLRVPANVAALLSFYAGVLHLYVAPEHLDAWWGYGAFFVGVGVAQVAFAGLVVRRPGTLTSVVGIAGHVVVLALYVVSRTRGVELGPAHSTHRLEPAGTLDLTVAAVEVGLTMLLVSLMSARAGRIAANLLLVAGGVLWASRLSGLLS